MNAGPSAAFFCQKSSSSPFFRLSRCINARHVAAPSRSDETSTEKARTASMPSSNVR